jgi:glycosyltransferase involved in cell wall biosynthesis
MTNGNSDWSASVVAFGSPSDARVASGYPRAIATALRKTGHLRREFSARNLAPLDVFRGAVQVGFNAGRIGLSVSRAWMWSRAGSERLSERLGRMIERTGDRGPFIQVGTLVKISPLNGPHLMRTDMTIAQARRAGYFAVGKLTRAQQDEAERVQSEVLSTAAGVFAASKWVAESLVGDCGVPEDRVCVLYPCNALSLPIGISQQRAGREILFVGIDWERKGGPLLYDAFRLVRRELPDTTLRIVGCRPMAGGDGVYIEGRLNKNIPEEAERLARCYLRASVFCLPSLFEPFGIVLAEAASVGLPCVAIDSGSRREAILDGVTGALAPEPTPRAVADALIRVLADPDRNRQMGEAAREHAKRHFMWDVAVERIGRVVCAVLAEGEQVAERVHRPETAVAGA